MKNSFTLIVSLLILLFSCQEKPAKDVSNNFTGTWTLLKCIATEQDGKTSFPFGENPRGKIIYDAHGKMMAVITHEEVKKFKGQNPFQGTPNEIIPAYNGTISYFGSYTIVADSSMIIHSIEACSFPNWVGQQQKRRYEFKDDLLILRTPSIGSIQYELIWKRN